jgi:predicted amidohydrolase
MICDFLFFQEMWRIVDVSRYVANWPKPRINAWDVLLKSKRPGRKYVLQLGLNRIGRDDDDLEYPRSTFASYQFYGKYIYVERQQEEGVFIITSDKNTLLESRKRYGFLEDTKFLVL